MEIKKYEEFDYLKLKQNEKICIIGPCINDVNPEILIRDIIEIDNNYLKIYCDYGHDSIGRRDFNVNDENNIEKIIKLDQNGMEEFHEIFELKYIKLNLFYVKLEYNDNISDFLDYIENDDIIDYITKIYSNNKLNIKALQKISGKWLEIKNKVK